MRDQREYLKDYYLRNRDTHLKRCAEWSKAHPESNKKSAEIYRLKYPERRALSNILQRCNNPQNHAYPLYGGRGIKCFLSSAEEIIAKIGKRPNKSYSIDRINNNGHYEADNIRWATKKQQANNRGH